MGNILGYNGAPLGINGAPITCASAGTDTSDATISSNSQLLYPYTSYGNGIKYTGSIQSQTAQTIYPSTSDQTISSGVYLSGTQTVKGVLLTNLSAGNIKKDVVVKVGDSVDDDRITSVTGTYQDGITPAPEKDVNFIDYDGTIVYSYTKSEFASLSAMPANPSHDGLTAQGWNWTLSDAKTYVATYGKLWIGQMYVTSSGKTEIDIELNDAGLLSPYLKIAVNGTVTIDWGDGSTANTVTGTSLTSSKYTSHTYATTGNYTISIGVTSGSFTFYDFYILSHTNSNTSNASQRYNSSIIAVRLGSGITSINYCAFYYCFALQNVTIPNSVTSIDSYAFYYCTALQSITIPNSVTSINNSAFAYCYSLQNVTIPNSVTSIGTYVFYYCAALRGATIPNNVTSIGGSMVASCWALQSVTIPNSVTSIGAEAFYQCTALQSVTIPSNVTSIGSSAFYNCYSIYKLTFKRTSPPTVSGSGVFNNLSTDCIIYVPSGSLSAYTSATNYPNSSTYTYVEET